MFNSSFPIELTLAVLTNTDFLIGFRDDNDSGYGKAVLSYLNSGTVVGIATSNSVEGESTSISYNGMVSVNEILVSGNLYYLGSDGIISTNSTGQLLGRAVTTNQLLLMDSTESDSGSTTDVVLRDGSQSVTGNLSMAGNSLTDLAEPSSSGDAATKNYVDTHSGGGSSSQLTTSFTVATGQSISAGEAAFFVNGTVQTNALGVGSSAVFDTSAGTSFDILAMDGQHVLAFYEDLDNSSYGTVRVGLCDGDSITWQAASVFKSNAVGPFTSVKLSEGTFAIACMNWDSGFGECMIGSLSDTNISWLADESMGDSADGLVGERLSDREFVLVYRSGTSAGTAVVGLWDGSTLVFAPSVEFNSDYSGDLDVAHGGSEIFITYANFTNSNYGTMSCMTWDGSVLGYFGTWIFNSANTTFTTVGYDTRSDLLLVSYNDGGSGYQGTMRCGSFNGFEMDWGDEQVINVSDVGDMDIQSLGSYADPYMVLVHSLGQLVLVRLSGDLSVIEEQSISFTSASIAYVDVSSAGPGQCVVAYNDGDSSDQSFGIPCFAGQVVGIAGESKAAGESCSTVIYGVAEMAEGLHMGSTYYVDTTGRLSFDSSLYRIGMAISTNEILLNPGWSQ